MVAPAPNRLQSKIPIRSCSHQKVIEGELVELAVLLFRPLPPQPSSIMRCVQSWRSLLSCFICTRSLQLEVLAFVPSSGFCVLLLELPIHISFVRFAEGARLFRTELVAKARIA